MEPAHGYKKLRVPQQSQRVVTADNAYWDRMQTVATIGEPSNVTSVAISPDAPYQVAAASSTRVAFYSATTGNLVHRLTRFKQAATCVDYRRDGALVAVGGEEGALRLYHANQHARSALRQFNKAHTGTVRKVKFSANGPTVFSCGDDKIVKRWHVGREECLFDTGADNSMGHSDFVRALDVSDADENVVISGSYDHHMKIWDCRLAQNEACVAAADHGFPIESVLAYPAARMIATAGGNIVKIWDVSTLSKEAGNSQPLATLELHHKTVTALAWASKRSRLCTASLDRHIKIVDVTTMAEVHSLECAAPILTLDLSVCLWYIGST